MPSMLMLPETEIKIYKSNLGIYERAQQLTNVPKELIAATHYRESSMSTSIKNPFQFDPEPDDSTRARLYVQHSFIPPSQVAMWVGKGVNDLLTAAVLAGAFLNYKCRYVHGVATAAASWNDEMVKDAAFGYNGRAATSPMESAYVVNGLDKAHMNMMIRGTMPDPNDPSKRIGVNEPDHRLGVYTAFLQLKKVK